MIVIRNYHKNSWKLHDCHKLTASLENETIVCFWMGRMRHIGHIGRMVMGQGDYEPCTAHPRTLPPSSLLCYIDLVQKGSGPCADRRQRKANRCKLESFHILQRILGKIFALPLIMVSPLRGLAGEERCPTGGCASLARRFTPGYLWCRPTGWGSCKYGCCYFVLTMGTVTHSKFSVRSVVKTLFGHPLHKYKIRVKILSQTAKRSAIM